MGKMGKYSHEKRYFDKEKEKNTPYQIKAVFLYKFA